MGVLGLRVTAGARASSSRLSAVEDCLLNFERNFLQILGIVRPRIEEGFARDWQLTVGSIVAGILRGLEATSFS